MKQLLSYLGKVISSRPWNFVVLSTAPFFLASMYYWQKKGYFSIKLSGNGNKGKRKFKDNSEYLFEKIRKHHCSVFFSNEEACKMKIRTMQRDGPELFQVISDFDWTMSRYKYCGAIQMFCHDFIASYPLISKEVKDKFLDLKMQYQPIEVDPSMTNAEKTPYMIEWWTKSHDLIVSCNVSLPVFEDTIRKCGLTLREDCEKFMETLNSSNVPLLIFSAGIGNVIDTLLRHKDLMFDNVRIVSNFMNFNKENILTGFQDAIIHCFNKSARSIQDSDFYENICTKRRNVLLIGDSTGDPHMSDGLMDDINVLKIGFLNYNVEGLKDAYLDIYDIVVVSDESFYVPRLVVAAALDVPVR